MIYPTSRARELAAETFEHPGAEYRGAPFWSWNCHVTKELVEDQIPIFQEMGMGAVTVHPRTGLDLPYMGDEFLERVRDACRTAKENGMKVVLYDEDNFPSGNAGGLVTIHPQYRSRYFRLTRDCYPDWPGNRAKYEQALAAGREPEGYYLCSYRIHLKNGELADYQKLECPHPEEPTEEDGQLTRVWNLYLCVDPWKEEAIPYVDTLNPEAVRKFIRVTYEAYEKALGEEFGSTAFAIFTDEPRIHNRNLLPFPEYEGDTTLAGTDDFSDTFEKAYGVPFLEVLPEIVWELPDQRPNYYRYAYNAHLTECFARSYSDQIGAWCEAHGIAFTGHLLSERTLFQQTYRLGDAMRQYRSYQIPGIDILCGDLEYTTAKQAVSVARQFGREGVTSELYGVTNWDHTFKGHKLQGDWQAALGVTLRVHHLAWMSMAGEGKRDWPGSIFYQSPWYRCYASVEDHFARVNACLTRGTAKVRVAVLHPAESYWLYFGDNARTQGIREQMDEGFENLVRWLIFGTIDFDFLCESLLPEQVAEGWYESEADGTLPVGSMKYDAVLLPDIRTLRGTTLRILEHFADGGGTVIFAGEIPGLVEARTSERARILARRCLRVPFQKYAVLKALEPFREIEIETPQGCAAEDLLTQLRTDGDGRWLFLCHSEDKTGNVDREEKRIVKVRGTWNPVLYDTWTGAIKPVAAEVKNGRTCIPVTLYAEDSLLLRLLPGAPELSCTASFSEEFHIVPVWKKRWTFQMPLRRTTKVSLSEPNVLLLDTPSWRLDDREWNSPRYCLSIEDDYRNRLRLPRTQPYRQKDVAPKGFLSLRYEIRSEISSEDIRAAESAKGTLLEDNEGNRRCADGAVEIALELQPELELLWNGVSIPVTESDSTGYYVDSFIRTFALPELKKGVNILEIRYPFGAKSMVEPCYLLGNFSVWPAGDRMSLGAPVTALEYGDITVQGLPFYTGDLTFTHRFAVDQASRWILEVPEFEAPVLEASLDGEKAGLIAFAPHRLALGELGEGGHTVSITAYGNRYNCFAPLHNADPGYKWYGPMSFRTTGYQWTNGYRVKPFGITDYPRLVPENPAPLY